MRKKDEIEYYRLLQRVVNMDNSGCGYKTKTTEESTERVMLQRMVLDGDLYCAQGRIYATQQGRDAYESACLSPYYNHDTRAWEEEARTGMKNNGDETDIENAATTTCPAPKAHKVNPEDSVIDRIDAKNRRKA